ncbi:nickel ABC transporter, nickel/metallophore periplasmic binding protein [Vibrio sp. CAIM 722]|uniref:Nickel ABC transporter, nickel/metallophore periplasmic binding protein n=1 Tax=Vibrio eleionomae TaxID=2653505 RepID=A0A7X4LPB5_9VIBR|nr:nickel ABC transporter substrate-binding protein [Vibrio eleionomae]MZI95669.1 nickel ABC transporter, nickel/metallophore periplasmic binding protein [Vibrio eleionomae]
MSLIFFVVFTPICFATHLNFAWPLNVGPLNPHLYSPNQMFAQSMVYEPLVKYQSDGSVKPWLASHWTLSADGRTYTFTLRHHVTFSNGEPFNAQAVVDNFRTVMDNKDRHAWLELTNQIESYKALNDDTFQLTLKHPYYPALLELSLPRPFRFIAPSQFIDNETKNGIKHPIGTGPWILTKTRLNQYDEFKRNEQYWGAKPAIESITVKVIPDPTSRALAVETGDVDLIYGVDGSVSPDTFERFSQSHQYTTELSPPIETIDLALNTKHSPTKELAVRLAINHSVDKEVMIKTVLYGTQSKANTLFAPTVPYANIGLKPYRYDIQLANSLLDKAGWQRSSVQGIRYKGKQRLNINLSYVGTNPVSKSMAEIIQGDLFKVGIEVNLLGEEEGSIYHRQKSGEFDMIFNRTWGAPYDPHAFLSSMRVPSHADFQAQQGLKDKSLIDQEIEQALISTDNKKRQALYRDILTRLHKEAVYLPLTWVQMYVVANPKFGPVPFSAIPSHIPFEHILKQR